MRKINSISLAVLLSSAIFVSCENDVKISGVDSRYVTLAVTATDGVETKAASSLEQFEAVDLSSDDMPLFLLGSKAVNNEDIFNVPMTKADASEHAYDVNKYGAFTVDMVSSAFPNYAIGAKTGASKVGDYLSLYNDGGEKIEWPSECDGVTFDFWAYNTLAEGSGSYSRSGEIVTYNGVAGTAAADFIVAKTSVKHDHKAQNLVNLKFWHTLSAVKFDFDLNKTDGFQVKKVEIQNVYNNGTFTVNESAAFNEKFVWTATGDAISYTYEPKYDASGNADDITFYIVPQALANVKVVFTLTKGDKTYEIATMGKNLGATQWEPGYVYTYTVANNVLGNVGIQIEENGWVNGNSTKNNVSIKNTKRSTVYVRAALIANWCNDNNQPVMPCNASEISAMQNAVESAWKLGDDSYFYCTVPVQGYANSEALLGSTGFTAPEAPMAGLHLEVKVLAQAVECDTDNASLTAAWGTPKSNGSAIVFKF